MKKLFQEKNVGKKESYIRALKVLVAIAILGLIVSYYVPPFGWTIWIFGFLLSIAFFYDEFKKYIYLFYLLLWIVFIIMLFLFSPTS